MLDNILAFDYSLFRSINGLAGKSAIWDGIFIFSAELIIVLLIVGLAVFIRPSLSEAFRRNAPEAQNQIKNRRERAITALSALAAGFFGRVALVPIIRILLPRIRPFLMANVMQLIQQDPSEASFPSGHATVMFALAFAVFFYNKKWGYVYLILALISGFSRVAVGVHYPIDILGGIAVGFVSALGVKLAVDYWLKK